MFLIDTVTLSELRKRKRDPAHTPETNLPHMSSVDPNA